ncbi:hypothetical protein ABK040_007618 [Willaertia magna]
MKQQQAFSNADNNNSLGGFLKGFSAIVLIPFIGGVCTSIGEFTVRWSYVNLKKYLPSFVSLSKSFDPMETYVTGGSTFDAINKQIEERKKKQQELKNRK